MQRTARCCASRLRTADVGGSSCLPAAGIRMVSHPGLLGSGAPSSPGGVGGPSAFRPILLVQPKGSSPEVRVAGAVASLHWKAVVGRAKPEARANQVFASLYSPSLRAQMSRSSLRLPLLNSSRVRCLSGRRSGASKSWDQGARIATHAALATSAQVPACHRITESAQADPRPADHDRHSSPRVALRRTEERDYTTMVPYLEAAMTPSANTMARPCRLRLPDTTATPQIAKVAATNNIFPPSPRTIQASSVGAVGVNLSGVKSRPRPRSPAPWGVRLQGVRTPSRAALRVGPCLKWVIAEVVDGVGSPSRRATRPRRHRAEALRNSKEIAMRRTMRRWWLALGVVAMSGGTAFAGSAAATGSRRRSTITAPTRSARSRGWMTWTSWTGPAGRGPELGHHPQGRSGIPGEHRRAPGRGVQREPERPESLTSPGLESGDGPRSEPRGSV